MKFQKIITGGITIFIGLVLIYFTYKETWIAVFYGFIIIGLGIVILLNKKEDTIERIKWKKQKK